MSILICFRAFWTHCLRNQAFRGRLSTRYRVYGHGLLNILCVSDNISGTDLLAASWRVAFDVLGFAV